LHGFYQQIVPGRVPSLEKVGDGSLPGPALPAALLSATVDHRTRYLAIVYRPVCVELTDAAECLTELKKYR